MKAIIIIIAVMAVIVVGVFMYRWLRPRPPQFVLSDASSPKSVMRDTLFGDMPIEKIAGDGASPPQSHFAAGKRRLEEGRREEAAACFKQVLSMPDLEARYYLQAWHFLRRLGHKPSPEEAKRVLGVVFEMPIQDGLDLVAAYPDHSARYWNFSGAGVVWEHPDTSLDAAIDRLLSAGAGVVEQIGVSETARPAPPPKGQVRISFLTPAGISFGQGPFEDLAADPKGAAVLGAATDLMRALMAKSQPPKP